MTDAAELERGVIFRLKIASPGSGISVGSALGNG